MFWKKTHVSVDEKDIHTTLHRGVAEVLPSREGLEALLKSGRRIRLYQGFDPTGTDLHIGHMVGLRKLAQFQKLGHEVVFLVGDGTGQAGDPSGKTKARTAFFSTEELRENARTYKTQAGKILQFEGQNPARIAYNSEWLNKLTLREILDIASQFTLQQLSERSVFQERMKMGEAVNLREFLYPILQGYDSVALETDLEIGATDQTFNMLMGRTLLSRYAKKEKYVLTTPLLVDGEGKKIGKSEGNVIALSDTPQDLYGKVLRLGDEVVVDGLRWLTDLPEDEIKAIEDAIAQGGNPKPYKELLAKEIIAQLYDMKAAIAAEEEFHRVFGEGGRPEQVREIMQEGTLRETLVREGIVSSHSEWRRLIASGAVKNLDTDEMIKDPDSTLTETTTLKIGKHRFVCVAVKN